MRIIQTSMTIGLLVLGLLAMPLRGQDNTGRGISVIGVGTAQVRPSVVEIHATLSADAELANDARVKERDAKARIAEAIASRSPGVTLESGGISVTPMVDPNIQALQARAAQVVVQNGVLIQVPQNQVESSRRIGVSEQLRLIVNDADKLETPKLIETVLRLIDIGRDAGLLIGQPNFSNMNGVATLQPSPAPAGPLIVCRLADNSSVRDTAYKAAIEDARQKASRLAELSGLKVGKVIGIQELDGGTEQSVNPLPQNQDASSYSNLLGEIPISVRLNVQFEVAK